MADVKVTYKGKERTVDQSLLEDKPLSQTAMKEFRKSPKHFVKYLEQPFVPTQSMILGQMIDVLALTPEKFDEKFMVYEKATGKGSVAKNNESKARAMEQKKFLVTPEDVETAKKAVKSLYEHEMASQLINNRVATQEKLFWRDKESNIPCIGYVDFRSKVWDEQFAVDLKAFNEGDPADFGRLAYFRDLTIQCGAYLDGYHKAKFKFPYFVFLVVETSEPFNVAINFVDTKTANYCREEWKGSLKAFRYCLDNKQFDKGYEFRLMDGMDYFSMRLPGYARPLYGEIKEDE